MSKMRVNRPETAAAVITELSKQARNIAGLFMAFGVTLCVIALGDYGLMPVIMGVCVAGMLTAGVYILALRVLVLNWHEVQFYRPSPRQKMRQVAIHSRGKTRYVDVVDRVGG